MKTVKEIADHFAKLAETCGDLPVMLLGREGSDDGIFDDVTLDDFRVVVAHAADVPLHDPAKRTKKVETLYSAWKTAFAENTLRPAKDRKILVVGSGPSDL